MKLKIIVQYCTLGFTKECFLNLIVLKTKFWRCTNLMDCRQYQLLWWMSFDYVQLVTYVKLGRLILIEVPFIIRRYTFMKSNSLPKISNFFYLRWYHSLVFPIVSHLMHNKRKFKANSLEIDSSTSSDHGSMIWCKSWDMNLTPCHLGFISLASCTFYRKML